VITFSREQREHGNNSRSIEGKGGVEGRRKRGKGGFGDRKPTSSRMD